MKQTCIMILGMHRSGTSALAGTLSLLDVYVGSDLMKADSLNEKGYFENNFLYKENEKILSLMKSSWDDLFINDEKIKIVENNFDLKDTIKNEFNYANYFIIKDPRLVYVFPLYEKVFKTLDIDLKVVIPIRDPLEVALSLKKRNHFSLEKGMLLWAYYVLLAEKYSRTCNRIFLEYKKLLEDPLACLSRLQEELSITFPKNPEDFKEEVVGFLDPSLKHHTLSLHNCSTHVPAIIKKIFDAATHPEGDSQATFDALYQELFEYKKLFYNKDVENTHRSFFETQHAMDHAVNTLKEKQDAIEKLQNDLLVCNNELHVLNADLSAKDLLVKNLKNELHEMSHSNSWKMTRPLRKFVRFFKEE